MSTAKLKGLAVILAILFVIPSASAQTYSVLYSFTTGARGALPWAGLTGDSAGNLYGTTTSGGDLSCLLYGCGTVFELSPQGRFRTLHAFGGKDDGEGPVASVVRDSAGNVYGTTHQGGAHGWGMVFAIDANGTETSLYDFTGLNDGGSPWAPLVRDIRGNLYGTTLVGGIVPCNSTYFQGCGTVFLINAAGKERVLHRFAGDDGAEPYGGVILDPRGNLYGVTRLGGDFTCDPPYGCGTVFKLDTAGMITVLHTFTGGVDGAFPWAGLIRDSAGNLYGTTEGGGDAACDPPKGCGVVFKIDSAGAESVLYSFSGGADGSVPMGSLIRDSGGALYGTTVAGGDLTCKPPYGCGTVFKLDASGHESVLHSFSGADGAWPFAGLVQDSAGNLYGTTEEGADYTCNHPWGCGVVFKITP